MARKPHTLGPLIAYHGCDRQLAEAVLAGSMALHPSHNEYDWLGPGIYFWVDSPERGLSWAQELATQKHSEVKDPCVVGALVHPSLCLNLTDYGSMRELRDSYDYLTTSAADTGKDLPRNTAYSEGLFLRRTLDCWVMNGLHRLREDAGLPAYDTVYGVFEEGGEIYPGAGFRTKTHIQIAVRNPECIVGYFRVSGL